MMTDTLMGKMGWTPILSGKLSIKISKMPLTKTMTFTVHVNKAYYWNRRGFQIGLKVHTCTLLAYDVTVHTYECTDIRVGCTVQCTCVLYITITRCVDPLWYCADFISTLTCTLIVKINAFLYRCKLYKNKGCIMI